MVQITLIPEDIPACCLGIGKGSSVWSSHDTDNLVEEIEADGAVLVVDWGALSVVVIDGDAVGPEETVGCSGAERRDVLAH